jgi:hypothetical protein
MLRTFVLIGEEQRKQNWKGQDLRGRRSVVLSRLILLCNNIEQEVLVWGFIFQFIYKDFQCFIVIVFAFHNVCLCVFCVFVISHGIFLSFEGVCVCVQKITHIYIV